MTTMQCDVVVIGAGPGGYSAAFRAADLGLKVILVEKNEKLGGVCLNVGCIPSKTLLHAAKVMDEAKDMSAHGIEFSTPKVDTKKLRDWKNKIITKLTGGLIALAKQRKVDVVYGEAKFTAANEVSVADKTTIQFKNAIIAVGSRPVKLPFIQDDPRIIDSTGALELEGVTGSMLVIGGGIIGLEMATVYRALGAKISIVELADQIIPGADKDIVAPLFNRIQTQYDKIMLETKVTKVENKKDGIYVTFEGKNAPDKPQKYDRVLVAVGRVPNGKLIDAEKAGVNVDERGFIAADNQLRTNVPHIFAIGDVIGNPMLAHKAHAEAHVAAEVIAGKKHYFEPRCIPGVAYTDPEIAWTGLTEKQAREQGINVGKGVFPWMANGRSLSTGRDEGLTKILFNKDTNRVIGGGIVGTNAGELIAEVSLAVEMACDPEDVALTIHPHPTLSETVAMAIETYLGNITDLYVPKKKD
jgi:dihydrolipoamide dehydrogenase